MQMEGEVVAVKKALAILLAITFICSVVVYGRDVRFSAQTMLENLTNFEDVPTVEDLVNVWQQDGYYDKVAFQSPYWADCYVLLQDNVPIPISPQDPSRLFHFGYVPLAYDSDYTIDSSLKEGVDYAYYWCYNAVGDALWFDQPPINIGGEDVMLPTNRLPIRIGVYHTYESYVGDNEVLEFFDNVKGFFVKLGATISLAGEMFLSVFDNLQYLLPWKNTVPKGV